MTEALFAAPCPTCGLPGGTGRTHVCGLTAPDEWQPTYEQATPLHIGPSEVIVDGRKYVPEQRLLAALAAMYERDAAAVAAVCDQELDRSGALLGAVRIEAANRRNRG